jgi:hypothetical protein
MLELVGVHGGKQQKQKEIIKWVAVLDGEKRKNSSNPLFFLYHEFS